MRGEPEEGNGCEGLEERLMEKKRRKEGRKRKSIKRADEQQGERD